MKFAIKTVLQSLEDNSVHKDVPCCRDKYNMTISHFSYYTVTIIQNNRKRIF